MIRIPVTELQKILTALLGLLLLSAAQGEFTKNKGYSGFNSGYIFTPMCLPLHKMSLASRLIS
jgi:hypothetical protein